MVSKMRAEGLRSLYAKYLPWFIIFLGVILRLRQYFFNRSLWLDEALLARNITERSFIGLLQPLGYEQNAPVGFILLVKLATLVGGPTSLALRFFPLVFGIVGLFFFYRVARHLLKTPGMLVALTFFSFATPMAYYSTEFKQYTGDVLATLILWYLFIVQRPKNKWWLAGIGAVMLWFSHASIFILVGLGLSEISLFTYAVPLWVASFGLDYLYFLRYNLSQVVINYWQGHFLLFPWLEKGNFAAYIRSIGLMFGFFVDVDAPWIHAILLLLGYASLIRKNVKNTTIFVLPIALIFIATGLQKYPFVPRLLLFLTPSLYIGIGTGVDLVIRWGKRKMNRVGVVAVMCLILPLLFWGTAPFTAQALVYPIKYEELEQVLGHLHNNYQPDDVIYVYYGAVSPFTVYAKQYGLDHAHVIYGKQSRGNLTGYIQDVMPLRGNARVWVVFSHIFKQGFFGEDRYIAGFLDNVGTRLDYYPQVGASLYLYDLRQK